MQQSSSGRGIGLAIAILFVVVGLALAGGGVWLAVLGGSLFYVAAGAGTLLTAALLLAGRRIALTVFAVVLAATLVWAAIETRFAWWPLAARGDVIFPMALVLLLPWVTRSLTRGAPATNRAMKGPLWAAIAAGTVVLAIGLFTPANEIVGRITVAAPATVASASGAPDSDQPDEDWRAYGRTEAGQRYSPLEQITPDNVGKLHVAWTFRTGDLPGQERPDRDDVRGDADQGPQHALSLLAAPAPVRAGREDRKAALVLRPACRRTIRRSST